MVGASPPRRNRRSGQTQGSCSKGSARDARAPLFETTCAEAGARGVRRSSAPVSRRSEGLRALAADVLTDVRFPQEIWDELDALKKDDGARYQHAVWTAVVAARLFRTALGTAPGLARLVGGALTHDIGMRHSALRLRFKRDHLTPSEALASRTIPCWARCSSPACWGTLPRSTSRSSTIPGPASATRACRESRRCGARYRLGFERVCGADRARTYRRSRSTPAGHRSASRGLRRRSLRSARGAAADPLSARRLWSSQPAGPARKPTGFRPPGNHHGVAPEKRLSA